jgi:hypothetical protein
MKKLTVQDLMGLSSYEKAREKFREEVIQHKKNRRLPVGDRVTLVFEDRKTILFQIQEMMRAERLTDLDKIKEEVDVYNALLPDPGELSATLFIEIEEQSKIREDLLQFLGIDEKVFLKIGNVHTIQAIFEEGHSKEDKISAVQYVRFPLDPEAREAFVSGREKITVLIDHPSYRAEAEIGEEMRQSLSRDLTE